MTLPAQKQSRLLPPTPRSGLAPPQQHNYQSLQHHHHHHHQQRQQQPRPSFDVDVQNAGISQQRSGIPQSFSFVESRQTRPKDKKMCESSTLKLPPSAHSSSTPTHPPSSRSPAPQLLPRQRQPSPMNHQSNNSNNNMGEPYVALQYQNSPRKVKAAQTLGSGSGEMDDAEKLKVLTQHIEIYTNWANHYLERADSGRMITNLQWDFREGILLADLIEAVVDEKVPNIQRPAQNQTHVLQNTSECFKFLTSRQVDLRNIEPQDICQGNLKSILELFFTLSRYKQLQKQSSSSSSSASASNAQTGSAGGARSSSPATKKDGVLRGSGSTSTSGPTAASTKMKGDLSGISSFNRREKMPSSSSSSSSSGSAAHSNQSPSVEQNNNNIDSKNDPGDSKTSDGSSNKIKSSGSGESGAKKTSMLTKLKLFGSRDKKKEEGGATKDKKQRDDVIDQAGGSQPGTRGAAATQLPAPQTRLPMPPPREPIVPSHPHHHAPHREVPKPAVPERTVTLPAGPQTPSRQLPQPQLPQRNAHSDSSKIPGKGSSKDDHTSLPKRDPEHRGTLDRKLRKHAPPQPQLHPQPHLQPQQHQHHHHHLPKPTGDQQLNLSTGSSSSSHSNQPASRLPNRTSSSTSISSMASCGSSFTSGGGGGGGMGSLTKKSGGSSNLRKPAPSGVRSGVASGQFKKPSSASGSMSNKLNTSEGSIVGGGSAGAKSSGRFLLAKGSKVQRALSAKENSSKIVGDAQSSGEATEKSASCTNTPLLDSSIARRIPGQAKASGGEGKVVVAQPSALQPSKTSSLKKAGKLGTASVRQLPLTGSSKLPKSSNLQPLNESLPLRLNADDPRTMKKTTEKEEGEEDYPGNCRGSSETLEEGGNSGLDFSTDDDDGSGGGGRRRGCLSGGGGLSREKSQNSFGSSGVDEEESNNSTSESTESVIYQPSSASGLEVSKTRSDCKGVRAVASASADAAAKNDDYNDDDDDDDEIDDDDDDGEAVVGVIEEEEEEEGEEDHVVSLRRNRAEAIKKKPEVSPDVCHNSPKKLLQPTAAAEDSRYDEAFELKPMEPFTRTTASSYMLGSAGKSSVTGVEISNRGSALAGQPFPNIGSKYQPSAFLEREERENGEGASGYMSDGDILRSSQRSSRQVEYCSASFRRHTDDSHCGYASEGSGGGGGGGGASLYARKMQQRFAEGIMAAQECLKKAGDDESVDNYSTDSSEEPQEEGGGVPSEQTFPGCEAGSRSGNRHIFSSGSPQLFSPNRIFAPQIPLNFTSKTFPVSVPPTPGNQQCLHLLRSPAGIFPDVERRAPLSHTSRNHCFSSSLDETIGLPRGRPLFERGIRERASLPIIGTHPGGFLTRRGIHTVPPIPEVVERVSPVVARKEAAGNTQKPQEPASSSPEVSSSSPSPQTNSSMKGSSMSINGSSLSISGGGRSKSKNSRLLSPVVAEREAMKGERLSNYSKGVMIYPIRSKVGQDTPITPQQLQQQHQMSLLHHQQQQQQQQQLQQHYSMLSPNNGTLRRRGSSGCADGISKWPYSVHPSLSQFSLDPSKPASEMMAHHQWKTSTLPVNPTFPNSLQAPGGRPLGPKLSIPNKYAANYDLSSGKPMPSSMVPRTSSASLPRQNHYHNIHQSRLAMTPTSPIYGGNNPASPQIFHRLQNPLAGSYGSQTYAAPLFGNASSSYHREENANGRGSTLSLGSSATSAYSNTEDQQQQEVKRLRQELESAQSRVDTLSSQLNTNAHVVIAFEQSLANMTRRLHHLTNATNQKDAELNELRLIIEQLKQQGARVKQESSSSSSSSQSHRQSTGSAGMFSMTKGKDTSKEGSVAELRRHMSSDSVVSSVSGVSHHSGSAAESEKKKKQKSWLASFGKAFSRRKQQGSSGSAGLHPAGQNKPLCSDADSDTGSLYSDASMVHLHSPSPRHHNPLGQNIHPLSLPTSPIRGSKVEPIASTTAAAAAPQESVSNLQQQLREKDMKLTDIQLEALSSAHQLEHLKETMNRMKNEMMSLKVENDRMQRIISQRGMSSSSPTQPSKQTTKEERLSLGDPPSYDLLLMDSGSRDNQKTTLSVKITPNKPADAPTEVLIGTIPVSGSTTWANLLSAIKSNFKEYLTRLDPNSSLGLTSDCISALSIGETSWLKDSPPPELLPCGYLVGDNTNISVILKGSQEGSVDGLSFETLIPKSILQRYVSLLLEHKRIILCGPSGTGKTHLAQKLAEHIVTCSGKTLKSDSIALFNVDHKTSKELRQYLSNIADQCEQGVSELPEVIILDSLHHVSSLREVFDSFLSAKNEASPYIIGTMSQAANSSSSMNLQLHHNFKWVLCANHVEPVKGFLGRFLKKKMIEVQVRMANRDEGDAEEEFQKLAQVVDWLPKVWQHLNKCLEAHSSSEVTIGPRLFLSCPIETDATQNWFTDLWNYSIVPYLLEAIREGIQTYGSRVAWEDPADWVIKTFPWTSHESTNVMTSANEEWPPLLKIRPEDVGYDSQGLSNLSSSSNNNSSANNNSNPMSPNPVMSGSADSGRQNAATTKNSSALSQSSNSNEQEESSDPLLNMLLRLQEAASYTSPSASDAEFASTGTADKPSSYSLVDQI